jgi:GNAT superfamily N-acetyltransferase
MSKDDTTRAMMDKRTDNRGDTRMRSGGAGIHTTHATDSTHMTETMDTQDVAHRILFQRMSRFTDPGPSLAPLGTARFRQEGARLRVAFASLAAGTSGEAVARVLRHTAPRGMQVQWTVVPQRPGEGELPAALLAARFRLLESLLLMAHAGPIRERLNPAVAVTPIATWQAMWTYEYGSRQAFFDDPDPSPSIVNPRARDRWREQEHGWCRYYTAAIGGRIVGGCYVSLFEEIPTIMGVYTFAEARNRGVATAMLARTIDDLVRAGRDVCCLFVKHDNPAEKLYRQLGFVPLVYEDTYVWDPVR